MKQKSTGVITNIEKAELRERAIKSKRKAGRMIAIHLHFPTFRPLSWIEKKKGLSDYEQAQKFVKEHENINYK